MDIYSDYDAIYGASGGTDFGILNLILNFMEYFFVFFVFLLILTVLMMISQYFIFKKFNKKGWIAFVPIYNMWVWIELADMPGWFSLIPFLNVTASIYALYKIALKLGKTKLFAILAVLFPVIFLPILAFVKDQNIKQESFSEIKKDENDYYNESSYQSINNNTELNNNQNFQFQQTNDYQSSSQSGYIPPSNTFPNDAMVKTTDNEEEILDITDFDIFGSNSQNNQPLNNTNNQSFTITTKTCPNCGNVVNANAPTCFMCGNNF